MSGFQAENGLIEDIGVLIDGLQILLSLKVFVGFLNIWDRV